MSNGDPTLLYSTRRSLPLNNYLSPVMISPSQVRVGDNRTVDNSFSPGGSHSGSSIYDIPVGSFNRNLLHVPVKRYTFGENGRKFGSIGEKLCCKVLEEFLEREVKVGIRPNFLKNPETGRNLELDVYDDQTKIAIEYNGQNHYSFVDQFHKNNEELTSQMKRDKLKVELCKKAGIKLIIVPYTIDAGKKGQDGKWKTNSVSPEIREAKLTSYILPFLHEYISN